MVEAVFLNRPPSSEALCSVRSFLSLVVRPGAPVVASDRSVRANISTSRYWSGPPPVATGLVDRPVSWSPWLGTSLPPVVQALGVGPRGG